MFKKGSHTHKGAQMRGIHKFGSHSIKLLKIISGERIAEFTWLTEQNLG